MIDLIVNILENKITDLGEFMSKPLVTVCGMIITVVIFYALLSYINAITDWLLKKVINVGGSIKFKRVGMFVTIGGLYVVMFMAYYYIYFDKWPTLAMMKAWF